MTGEKSSGPTKFVRPLLRDQAIRHVTAEAGGYGDPLLRDPARVLDDVRNGKVSVQAAERDYGVRVSGPPWCVEEPATRALRAARASSPDTATPPPNGVIGVGTRCQAHERDSLERLCRYIARPAVSNERLSVNDRGAGRVSTQALLPRRDDSCRARPDGLHAAHPCAATPSGQPPAVQIGNPADLASPASPPLKCRSRSEFALCLADVTRKLGAPGSSPCWRKPESNSGFYGEERLVASERSAVAGDVSPVIAARSPRSSMGSRS